jgi:hypothetical protein
MLAAFALILFGVEVATGAVSLGFVRLWTGFDAFLNGGEAVISTQRYLSGLALLSGGGGLLVAMLWAERAGGKITAAGSICPNCGTATKRVRRRKRHRILSRILEANVTRRHCEKCGWSGLAA